VYQKGGTAQSNRLAKVLIIPTSCCAGEVVKGGALQDRFKGRLSSAVS
jgi:hypothetical protein